MLSVRQEVATQMDKTDNRIGNKGWKDTETLSAIFFPPLMFLSGFVSYILYHDYGPLAPEVLLAYLVLGVAGLAVGILLAKAGPTNLRAFGIGLLLLLYVDVHMGFFYEMVEFLQVNEGLLFRYAIIFLCFFVIFLAILTLRKKLASIVTVMFATMLVSTVALPLEKVAFGSRQVPVTGLPATDLPPVIHIVLDGHIGIAGVPEDIEGGPELRRVLSEFYERWGFRVFSRAYSKYFMTYNSLPSLLNGVASSTKASNLVAAHEFNKSGLAVNRNLYFQQAGVEGYRTRVFQSDYLDFCQSAGDSLESCYVYSGASPQLVRDTNLPLAEKAELIVGSYANDSGVYTALRVAYRLVRYGLSRIGFSNLQQWERKNYELSSLGVPEVIARLESDIKHAPHGRLFFAHLLLPHGPYIWDRDCRLKSDSDTWLSRSSEHRHIQVSSDPEHRAAAYSGYFEQTHCLVSLLDKLLVSLDEEGLLEETKIFIHGDHGSRITITDPVVSSLNGATARDFVDAFSTLLAIRSPSLAPGDEQAMRSIQSIFAEYVLNDIQLEDDGTVLLQTGSKEMIAVPMPQF